MNRHIWRSIWWGAQGVTVYFVFTNVLDAEGNSVGHLDRFSDVAAAKEFVKRIQTRDDVSSILLVEGRSVYSSIKGECSTDVQKKAS